MLGATAIQPSLVTGRMADPDFLVSIIKQNLEIAKTGSSVMQSIEFDPNTHVLWMQCGLGSHERYADTGAAPKFEIRVRNVDCNHLILDEVEPLAVEAMENLLGRTRAEINADFAWIKSERKFEVFRNKENDTLHVMINSHVWKAIKEGGFRRS